MQTNWKNHDNGRIYIVAQVKDLLGYYTIAVANAGEKKNQLRFRAVYASKVKDEALEQQKIDEIQKKRRQRKYKEV